MGDSYVFRHCITRLPYLLLDSIVIKIYYLYTNYSYKITIFKEVQENSINIKISFQL